MRTGQVIKIAPKEVQQFNRLLSTNWLLATADGKNVGLVPVNYIQRKEVTQIMPTTTSNNKNVTNEVKQPQVIVNEESMSSVPINMNNNSKSEETSASVVTTNDEEKSSVMV